MNSWPCWRPGDAERRLQHRRDSKFDERLAKRALCADGEVRSGKDVTKRFAIECIADYARQWGVAGRFEVEAGIALQLTSGGRSLSSTVTK